MHKPQPTASTSKHTLSVTPSLSSVGDGSGIWDSDDEYIGQGQYNPPQYNRFPLRFYLKYSSLPLFKHVSRPSIPVLNKLAYAPEWPKFRQLSRPVGKPGRRVLKQVNRLTSDAVLSAQVKRCSCLSPAQSMSMSLLINFLIQVSARSSPLLCNEPRRLTMNSLLACIFHAWISSTSMKKTNSSSPTSATKTTFTV